MIHNVSRDDTLYNYCLKTKPNMVLRYSYWLGVLGHSASKVSD